MFQQFKFQYDCTPLFLFRKHHCFQCGNVLARKRREKVVHSESPEAKDYDFTLGDSGMYGYVKFITCFFECPHCKTVYEIVELKKAEKTARRAAREAKGKTGFYKLSDYIVSVLESIRNGFSKYKGQLAVKKKKLMEKECMVKSKKRIYSLLLAFLLIFSLIAFAGQVFFLYTYISGELNQEKTASIRNIGQVKYSWDANPFYVFCKEHNCPKCGTKLKTSYYSVIVNSDSPEAKNYDFSSDDGELTGDVEFRTMCFKCPKCEIKISFDEMKRLEKQQKLSP